MITDVEKKIADSLAGQGIDSTTASSIANGLTGLTLTGIGALAGLDVASTATAVNIDANNRQLHPSERARTLRYQGKVPKTWGEAIEFRVQKQSSDGLAPKDWANQFPNGSIYDPEVKK